MILLKLFKRNVLRVARVYRSGSIRQKSTFCIKVCGKYWESNWNEKCRKRRVGYTTTEPLKPRDYWQLILREVSSREGRFKKTRVKIVSRIQGQRQVAYLSAVNIAFLIGPLLPYTRLGDYFTDMSAKENTWTDANRAEWSLS
jgi:hypothetical protein